MKSVNFAVGAWVALITIACGGGTIMADSGGDWVFVGGYSSDVTEPMREVGAERLAGICVADYDPQTGKLSGLRCAAEINSPNFFSLSPKKDILYTCCGGGENLAAYKIDATTGNLSLLNRGTNGGNNCCHVEVSPDGNWLVGSNYSGGDFTINRINPDGSLDEVTETLFKPGDGPDAKRQDSPKGHAGYFVPDAKNREILRVFLVDLGTDRVHVMRLDRTTGKLSDDPDIATLHLPAGAGCRHLAWHQNENGSIDVFVNNEIDSTVSFFTLTFGKGSAGLVYWGTWLTVPEEFRTRVSWDQSLVDADEHFTLMNSTAEAMYRNGVGDQPPTVYVSNRGHNSLAVFQVVQSNGIRALKPIQFAATGGVGPRYFCLDETQKHALVANKRSGTIVTFGIADDGTLTPTGWDPVVVGWPAAMAIVPQE